MKKIKEAKFDLSKKIIYYLILSVPWWI